MQKRFGIDLEIPDAFGHWLAGFTDGEGHFGACISINPNGYRQLYVSFKISLRADDEAALRKIRDTLKIGWLWGYHPYDRTGRRNPVIKYTIRRIGDLYHIIIPLFEKYPLQTKKTHDFEVWKTIVDIKYHEGGQKGLGAGHGSAPLPESFWAKVEPLVQQLKTVRQFTD